MSLLDNITKIFRKQKKRQPPPLNLIDLSQLPPRQPVLILTVYNRYFELVANLKRIHRNLMGEFPQKPVIVVIWANPDEDRRWVFEVLQRNKYIDFLIDRPRLEGEGGATTYPESYNLSLGLSFARNNFPNSYVIFQACDSFFRPGVYNFISAKLLEGKPVVATAAGFQGNLLCTGGFGILPELLEYWPPLVNSDSAEILEFDWKKKIGNRKVTYFHDGYFHCHDFETLQAFLAAR